MKKIYNFCNHRCYLMLKRGEIIKIAKNKIVFKGISVILPFFLFFTSITFAQKVTIPAANTSSGSGYVPLGGYFGYVKSAAIYTPTQIGSTGTITNVRYYLNSVATPSAAIDVRVYMKERATTFSANSAYSAETTGSSLVYGPVTIPAASFVANSWIDIPLATNFVYSGGTNNLEVIVETNATGGGNEISTAKQFRYNTQANNQYFQTFNADDSPSTSNGTRSTSRPNIQLIFLPTSIPGCASSFVPADLATTTKNPTLSWADVSIANSYDVYFGTTTNPPLIGNQTTLTYAPGILNTNTQYFWKVIPKNILGDAIGCTEQSFTTNSSFTYCSSAPTTLSGTGITNVKLNTIDYSNTNVTYTNNSATTINLAQGAIASNLITFATGVTYNTNIWIDLNNNGSFADAGELLFQGESTNVNPVVFNASFLMPENATLGNHTMRIGTADSGQSTPNPCYSGTLGVTIDFNVNVTPMSTDTPDYVSLQYPGTLTIPLATAVGTPVYAQVYESNLTDVEPGISGQAPGIQAWIGISPVGQNTNPNTWTTWIPAAHNAGYINNNDEYSAAIGTGLPIGTYYYASRFKLNSGASTYGGIDAGGNGNFWNGTTYNSGVLTITNILGDNCSAPISLALNTTTLASNASGTLSTETPSPACGFPSSPVKDVWFSVVIPSNVGRMMFETTAATGSALLDTGIAVYRGSCGSLTLLGCDDDSGVDNFSLATITTLTPGETILVRAWGYQGTNGAFNIKASIPASCGVETRWNGTAWSNGTPVAGIVAVMNGNYSGAGFTACALDVIGTSQVNIISGSNLIIDGLVNVVSTATLTLESNANLVQVATGANSGIITVKRESAQLVRLDNTLWSSPVAAQKLFTFSPNTLTNRFYTYDTPTSAFVTTGLSATSDFATGKAYAIRAANNHPSTPTIWLGSFNGIPNNGTKTVTLLTTGVGFNLVGNPYPSVIDAALFTAANTSITGTLYFYAHTLSMDATGNFPAGSNYALWNSVGGTAATLGTSGVPALVPNGKIQVGQGFFVKTAAAGSVTFNNSMREGSNANQFLRVNAEVEKHRMWLNLTNTEGTEFNQILVGYIDGATQGIDRNFDGLSFGNEGSALSSRLENEDYTIQGRALPFLDSDVVSLGFKAVTAGNYSISLASADGLFATNQVVYLKDNTNGSVTNLKTSSYSFISQIGTFNSRFELVFRSSLGTPETTFDSNSVIAFIRNNQLNVQTKGTNMKSIMVYDIRGRVLSSQSKIDDSNIVLSGLTPQNQVLVVQVTSENDEVVNVKVIF